jgi:hypothetical protein
VVLAATGFLLTSRAEGTARPVTEAPQTTRHR